MTTETKDDGRPAAITGAGGGLGREIAIGLTNQGYRVFGTALTPEAVADVERASARSVRLTVCDITDEAAVRSWGQETSTELGEGGFDVLYRRREDTPTACARTGALSGRRVTS